MKKSLIALGVLAAASAASAQNVTIYGIMDGAVVSGKSGNVSTSGLVSGGHSTSRLGFRGTEDLGGGLRAQFGLESSLNLDTGTWGGPSGATGTTIANNVSGSFVTVPGTNRIFNRGAFVGLAGGFGTINAGSIAMEGNGFLARHLPGSGNFDAITMRSGVFASGNQFAVWRDNTVEYISPAINGLTATLRYTFGNTSSSAQAATSTGSEGNSVATKKFGQGTELALNYTAGKLTASYFNSTVNLVTSNTAAMSASGFGATYDFGFMRAGISQQEYDPTDAASNDRRKLIAFGGAIPLSPAMTLTANYADLKVDGGAATKYWSAGAHYALSKRSTAYAFYSKADNNTTGAEGAFGFHAGNSQFIATPSAGLDATAMGVGLRHSF